MFNLKIKKKKRVDILVVSLMIIISNIVSLIFNLKPLFTGIFLLIPSFYMVFREKKNLKKIFIATFLYGFLAGFIFDFFEVFNKSWVVNAILPKVLGIMPLDNLIGYIIMSFLMILFYEHFLDDERNKKISKNFILGLLPFLLVFFSLIAIFLTNPSVLKIPYAYLIGGLFAIIFPIIFSFFKPRIIPKFLVMFVYFFFVWLLTEIVAVKTGAWTYPGEYIGLINLFGVTFPIEELFFWCMWYASSITAYYEFFIDDQK